MADLEDILSREAELSDVIQSFGDEPPTPPGESALSHLRRGLTYFQNRENAALISLLENFKDEKFFPSDIQSIGQRAKYSSDQDLGFADTLRYALPEVNVLEGLGLSKEFIEKPRFNFVESLKSAFDKSHIGPNLFTPNPDAPRSSLKDYEEGIEKIISGVGGFIGDAINPFDPINYLTFGGKAVQQAGRGITKAAGKFLTKEGSEAFAKVASKVTANELLQEAAELAGRDKSKILRSLELGNTDQVLKLLNKANNPKGIQALSELQSTAIDKALIAGDKAASDAIGLASNVLKREGEISKLGYRGVAKELLEAKTLEKIDREKVARTLLEIGEDVPISNLFEKETLRFAGREIPYADEVFKAIGAGTQKTIGAFSRGLDRGIAEIRALDSDKLDMIANGIESLRRLPGKAMSLVSRRVASGGGDITTGFRNIEKLKSYERGRVFNDMDSLDETNRLFSSFKEEDVKTAYGIFEDVKRRHAMMLAKNPSLDIGEVRDMLIRKHSQTNPEAVSLYKYIQKDYDKFLKKEQELGINVREIEDYMNREYLVVPGHLDKRTQLSIIGKREGVRRGASEGFALERHFDLIDQAVAAGFEPVTDLRYLYSQRLAAHNAAVSGRKFMHQVMIENSLSPQSREILSKWARDSIQENARATPAIIAKINQGARELGVELTSEDLAGKVAGSGISNTSPIPSLSHIYENVDGIWGVPRDLNDIAISPERYDQIREIATNLKESPNYLGEGFSPQIKAVIDRNKFDFSEQERLGIQELWKNYQEGQDKLAVIGKNGQFLRDAAGTSRIEGPLKKYLEANSKRIDPDTAKFLDQDLPTPIVNMLNDSYLTRNYLESVEKSEVGTELGEAIKTIKNGMSTTVNAIRLGSTQIWPSYWIGNVSQAQFQGLQAVHEVGSMLNPYELMKNRAIWAKKADLITEAGERVSNAQLMREMNQNQIRVSLRGTQEVMNGWAGVINQAGIAVDPKTLKPVGNTALDRLGGAMENFGRQNLYVTLRKKGYSMEQAAEETNRIMVDYVHGKTSFEQKTLSNLFLFYAFARQNTSNSIRALLTNPGSLGKSMDYRRLVMNLMKDEEARTPEDFYDNVATLKSSEGMPAYIGEDPETGNPKIINSFRTPLEESNRLFPVRVPQGLTKNAIWDSIKENVKGMGMVQFSALNPLIKGSIEMLANKNFYFNKPVDDPSLNQRVKLEAILANLSGEGPVADPTQFDPRMKYVNEFLPPLSMLNTRLRNIATSKSLPEGLLSFFGGIRTNTVDPDKSGAYERLNKLDQFILNNYGVKVGNRKPETLIEDIGMQKEGINPVRVRREQKELEKIFKLIKKEQRDKKRRKARIE